MLMSLPMLRRTKNGSKVSSKCRHKIELRKFRLKIAWASFSLGSSWEVRSSCVFDSIVTSYRAGV